VPVLSSPSASAAGDDALRLLVVDDDPELLELWGVTFELDFDVRLVGSADDALAALAADSFDAVLTDLNMPERDGAWLLEQVRAKHPGVRRFLMSSNSRAQVAARVHEDVAAAFFQKPVDREAVVAQLAPSSGTRPRR
jgi:DNA-binding NtrC family response regulator